jgi:hypothetical protein
VGIHFIDPSSDERGEGNGRRAESGERQYVIHPSPLPHVSLSILIQTHSYITTRSIYQSTHPLPYGRQSIPLLSSSVIHKPIRLSINSSLHEPTTRPSTHQEIHQSMHPFTYSTSSYPPLILLNLRPSILLSDLFQPFPLDNLHLPLIRPNLLFLYNLHPLLLSNLLQPLLLDNLHLPLILPNLLFLHNLHPLLLSNLLQPSLLANLNPPPPILTCFSLT